jgi:hypothetical protein
MVADLTDGSTVLLHHYYVVIRSNIAIFYLMADFIPV